MQILVLATQNEAPPADLGVATSTVTFFRTVGGSVGVALFGALFNHRIGELLGAAAPGMTPEQIAALRPDQQAATAAAFADAITTVFRYAVRSCWPGSSSPGCCGRCRCAPSRARPARPP